LFSITGNDPATQLFAVLGLGFLSIIGEGIAEAVGTGIVYLLWQLLRAPFLSSRRLHPVVEIAGLIIAGAGVGGLSYLLHAERLLPDPGPRGISLIAAPLLLGLAMEVLGRWQRDRGRPTSLLLSFRGGALCALSMAFTRYLLFF
jgi:hypothetical protein